LLSLGQHKKEVIIRNALKFRIITCNNDYVKFLGVPIDKNLTWRPHIDCIALKISKIVGTLARLFKTSFTFQYSSSNLPLPEISLHAFRYTCLGAGSSAQLLLCKNVFSMLFSFPTKDLMPSLSLLL